GLPLRAALSAGDRALQRGTASIRWPARLLGGRAVTVPFSAIPSTATGPSSSSGPPIPATPLLQVEGLSQRYGGRRVLRDIDFTLQPGESLGIIGESGAGKSTLARL